MRLVGGFIGRSGTQLTVAAVVDAYDQYGNVVGVGPSDDPGGVFFGRSDLQAGDVWGVIGSTGGLAVVPLPGGSFTWTGTGSFTWEIQRNNVSIDSGVYTISP